VKEIKAILSAYETSLAEGKKTALVTLVHVEGSSYRRPGARMLVTEDGEMTGAISGGCLEGDALRKALSVMNQQQSRLVTYDTTDEDDATIGIQLGCAGIIQVLMEPIIAGSTDSPIVLLQKAVAKRQSVVLVTCFSPNDKKNHQPGTCLLTEEDGLVHSNLPNLQLKKALSDAAAEAIRLKKSAFALFPIDGQNGTAFIEYIPPPIALVIFGAGNDVLPLVAIAHTLGWPTTVVDGRPTHTKKERFIASCQVLLAKPEQVLEKISIDQRTAVLLMTHNYNYDLAMLGILANTGLPYLGVLGPKRKLDRMIAALEMNGLRLTEEQLQNIHGPIGLNIGAETAEEIALSASAEISAVMAGKNGQPLRDISRNIHPVND
jgi:xanthine dehydrogenase accessory factor